jgi:hypothetical protein
MIVNFYLTERLWSAGNTSNGWDASVLCGMIQSKRCGTAARQSISLAAPDQRTSGDGSTSCGRICPTYEVITMCPSGTPDH